MDNYTIDQGMSIMDRVSEYNVELYPIPMALMKFLKSFINLYFVTFDIWIPILIDMIS